MDKNKLSKKKLAGLRTLATDKDKVNPSTKYAPTEELKPAKGVEAIPVAPTPEEQPVKKTESDLENITEETHTDIPQPPVVDRDEEETAKAKADIISAASKLAEQKNQGVKINSEEDFSAMVITDTKKDRFNLFTGIVDSIKKWFEKTKKNLKEKKKPKYTVPETTRRKGVIQKATSKTGITASSDYENLQERIRQRQEKESHHEPRTIWTPNTDTQFPLLDETTEEEPATLDTKARDNFQKDQQESVEQNKKPESVLDIKDNEPEEPTPPATVREQTDDESETSDEDDLRWSSSAVKAEKPTNVDQDKPEKVQPAIEPPTGNIKNRPVIPPSSKKKKRNFFNVDTNTLSFGVTIMFVLLIAGGALGYLWFKEHRQTPNLPTSNVYTGVIDHEVEFFFEPITSQEAFIERITSEYSDSTTDIMQFSFVTSEEKKHVIKPGVLLGFLGIDLDPSFNRSISQLYFGSISTQNKPFIALKVTDNNAALAGMLNWESDMRDDLIDLFKLQEKTSSLATTTEEQTPEETQTEADADFTDGSLSGIDVRVWRNQTGEEQIIYGFVDQQTIIITTNHATLGEILELMKQ